MNYYISEHMIRKQDGKFHITYNTMIGEDCMHVNHVIKIWFKRIKVEYYDQEINWTINISL